MGWKEDIQKRRTFAIISHPDAGKTTLTEKFLLYGGAVQLAGSVTARKNQRQTTSDWMELERKRGISISSTVLQFDYNGYRINLLDTPGHQDFSEDTYRVLTAVDGVIMVIDAGKGIEAQTKKLFEVCRRRHIPIFTFLNKCDRPTLDPLALIDEVEEVLGISAVAMNWPLGTGEEFRGVYERQTQLAHFYERTAGGAYRAPLTITSLHDEEIARLLSPATHARLVEEIAMLDVAGASYNPDEVLNGRMTPIYFGSAKNNFGVQLLLDNYLAYAAPPLPRVSGERFVMPDEEVFSGFIFKIQANMDPRHRDRIAFLRICSGKFTRDMSAIHARTGKRVRLANSQKTLGQSRETIDEACAGDIVGFIGQSDFRIGDTLTEDPSIAYDEIPRFPSEHFVFLHNPSPSNYKKFRDGLDQLAQEGVVQVLYRVGTGTRVPILAAVGPLQFDVVQYRLEAEYGAPSRLEPTEWKFLRWLPAETSDGQLKALIIPSGSALVEDEHGQVAVVFPGEWALNYFMDKNDGVALHALPAKQSALAL
ncbi:MAG: peptide chain release factor 3 [Ignavibacteria bacterium]